MHYYGTRLSENISRREPEGYLLCLNVPVARTGSQDYLPEELGLPPRAASGGNSVGGNLTRNKRSPRGGAAPIEGAELPSGSAVIPVLRPEEEVFSPETIASFEGMPVTNDHPPEGVDIGNIRALQKGHAHNVRRGTGDESDQLLADLIITDPHLIDLILEEGKREISCGYTYELCEENGQYIQRKIRGNHVAVVDAGRAGPRVSIKDHKVNILERRTKPMKKSLVKKLVRMAKDGDPEAIEAVAELLEEVSEAEAIETAAPDVVVVETPGGEEPATASGGNPAGSEVIRNEQAPQCGAATIENAENVVAIDEESFAGILERLDQIISLLTPAAQDEDPVEEIVEAVGEAVLNRARTAGASASRTAHEIEGVAEAAMEEPVVAEELAEGTTPEEISEIVEEILDPVLSETLEEEPAGDECGEPEEASATDALRAALNAIRPALVRMPKKQRRKVAADIAARMQKRTGRKASDGSTYAALAAAARRKAAVPGADLGRRIMANRNPNYKH